MADWVDLYLCRIDGQPWGVALEIFLLIVCFAGLALVCDNHLVPSLETFCLRCDIREDVAGASILAFGSAAPEIVINAVASIKGHSSVDLGTSAILGSGLIAFSIIPGVCAVSCSRPMDLKRRPLLRDTLFYAGALALMVYFFSDGVIQTYEAGIMVGLYVVFLLVLAFAYRIRRHYRKRRGKAVRQMSFVLEEEQRVQLEKSLSILQTEEEAVPLCDAANSINTEGVEEEEEEGSCSLVSKLCAPLEKIFEWTTIKCERGSKHEGWYPFTLAVSLFWVAAFSFVISAVVDRFVALSGVDLTMFGLFLVSIGAEIPDTVQSVTVARRGYASMAVSNCTASQVTNVLLGLGFPWLLCALSGRPVHFHSVKMLTRAALFQCINVCSYLFWTIGMGLCRKNKKALLKKSHGIILLVTYFLLAGGYVFDAYS